VDCKVVAGCDFPLCDLAKNLTCYSCEREFKYKEDLTCHMLDKPFCNKQDNIKKQQLMHKLDKSIKIKKSVPLSDYDDDDDVVKKSNYDNEVMMKANIKSEECLDPVKISDMNFNIKKEVLNEDLQIKREIKSEPLDQCEYYENLIEVKTEIVTEEVDKHLVKHDLDINYNIKAERSDLEMNDPMSLNDSDKTIIYKKEADSVAATLDSSSAVCNKAFQLKVILPAILNETPDIYIKKFFKDLYGTVLDFERTPVKKSKTLCCITLEDKRYCVDVGPRKNTSVMFKGVKLHLSFASHESKSVQSKSVRLTDLNNIEK